MISALAWVPAGVADPSPKRYELSAVEREMLQEMEAAEQSGQGGAKNNNDHHHKQASTDRRRKRGTMEVQVPAAASELPADLRMDEYSDDDDENDQGAAVGQLLLDPQTEMEEEDDGEAHDGDKKEEGDHQEDLMPAHRFAKKKKHGDDGEKSHDDDDDKDDDDDDDEEEDDLEDVPDQREFTPIDMDGLDSMGLYNIGMGIGADREGMKFEDEEDSEAEDVRLTEDDAIILVTKTEDDFAALEVHVYDQKLGNLYVHHDIPLPSFPLCLAHGQVNCDGTTGNYCAVGTFDTGIEIWNLDVLNALEPSCILGGQDTSATDMMMKRQAAMAGGGAGRNNMGRMDMSGLQQQAFSLRPGSHTEAVMALSWNTIHKQVIASGSADKTVKLWDVTQAQNNDDGGAKCNAATFRHHKGKVQSVVWHPKEGTLLATGSFDKTVALVDARSNGENVKTVKIPSDCEVLAWDPFHPEQLTVGTEDGTILCWDVRQFESSSPLWTKVANEFGGLSDLTFSPHVPGLFATCAVDKTVTIWDSYHDGVPNNNMAPRPCGSKDMCAGKLYSAAFYGSAPLLLACGGSGNLLSLWSMEEEEMIQKNFGNRLDGGGDAATAAKSDNVETPPPNHQEDLKAMMAQRKEEPQQQQQSPEDKKKSKKNKGKKAKRKAHKKGG